MMTWVETLPGLLSCGGVAPVTNRGLMNQDSATPSDHALIVAIMDGEDALPTIPNRVVRCSYTCGV